METKLYVGNMSHDTNEQDLRTMFSEAGTVGSVDIIMDRQTGEPRGFAFVTMSSQDEAEKAVVMFNAMNLNANTLKVNIARSREERPTTGGRPTTF
ncbi:MAG: RNA-binding protein [Chloroflexi bacterium]|nr:RNA-binding protein [Chloroflexota bacterium]